MYGVLNLNLILNRRQSEMPKENKIEKQQQQEEGSSWPKLERKKKTDNNNYNNSGLSKYSATSGDEDVTDSKWNLELAWLTKALEPALQLCRWALPTGLSMHLNII